MESDMYSICQHCGSPLEWESCWQCMGEGSFDLYEEDPVWYLPGATETCQTCEGAGGYLACPTVERHRERAATPAAPPETAP